MDLGASGYFLTKDAPKKNADITAPQIQLVTAYGQPMTYAGTCELFLLQLPSDFPTTGHVVQGFQEKLVGVVPMCYSNCTVTSLKHAFNIYSPNGTPLITG